MQLMEKFLDDAARLAGGAVGVVSDLSKQAGEAVRSKVDAIAHGMDIVPREDFERLEAVVEALRAEHEALKTEVEALKK